MNRGIFAILIGAALGAGGMTFAQHHEDGESVKIIGARDIKEKLDDTDTKVTFVEVTLNPGKSGLPHRHPGPGFVYVLEGEYELGIDDQPTKVFKAGETFYEPTGCLHRVSKNPAAKGNTRLIAVVLHPRDAKQIAVPELKKE
ncbi:MAG: Cupin domain protein [Planctomycetaceae bacterium]|nr:Cupin domain protein [Planctomycetaceae bacterium]